METELLRVKHVQVFNIPPRNSASRGHKASDWNESHFLWQGSLIIKGHEIKLCLQYLNDEIFAQCPYEHGSVEQVTDSSRYFVLKLVDLNTNKHAFVGLGFEDRNDAFDFNVILQDFSKKSKSSIVVPSTFSVHDFSLKEGEMLNLPIESIYKRNNTSSLDKNVNNDDQFTASKVMSLSPPQSNSVGNHTTFLKSVSSKVDNTNSVLIDENELLASPNKMICNINAFPTETENECKTLDTALNCIHELSYVSFYLIQEDIENDFSKSNQNYTESDTANQYSAKDKDHSESKIGIFKTIYWLSIKIKLTIQGSKMFFILFVFRLFNSFLLTTFHVPDEYYQSLEPAHQVVYGNGYITWEWVSAIRSSLHPLLYCIIYLIQKYFIKSNDFVIYGPKILNATFAAMTDYFLYLVAKNKYGEEVANWTVFHSVVSWWNFYALPRSLANSLETLFSTSILFLLLKKDKHLAYLIISISSCFRITNIIMWIIPLCKILYLNYKQLKSMVLIGLLMLCASIVMDSLYYGRLVFVMLNFLEFNVLRGLSSFYGTHPWHWYFSQGVWVISTIQYPLFIFGFFKSPSKEYGLIVFSTILFYSALSHKEFRFIHPILPIIHLYCGVSMKSLSRKLTRIIVFLIILFNIPLAIYFSCVHQRGVIEITNYIRENVKGGDLFLMMPCHSTPLYSYIHNNVTVRMLTCEPPLNSSKPQYIDETSKFYNDPFLFVNSSFNDTNIPSRLILFDSLLDNRKLNLWVQRKGYILLQDRKNLFLTLIFMMIVEDRETYYYSSSINLKL
ncbi:Adaptin ear-binding coat-associated protein 1 NECAP-1 domain-containing protein [Rozella allomycis CSF55]|uniref:Mannosyltransferase n=1 Tax=Rozella allomycis (strain CSF55) TaxID=988480 RepID=A0A075B289_ROZAC|nr:Adaptin ear-binding coat-associated protein 1 NECAP-1 domain-containing protein [Rozella allomycis CSF55]|eukprot:EPZ34938.1 Adaptin ear-binding coat-associated protein 1 NECAP-1 domain-containing protein [Rozella allomycis CSF55]